MADSRNKRRQTMLPIEQANEIFSDSQEHQLNDLSGAFDKMAIGTEQAGPSTQQQPPSNPPSSPPELVAESQVSYSTLLGLLSQAEFKRQTLTSGGLKLIFEDFNRMRLVLDDLHRDCRDLQHENDHLRARNEGFIVANSRIKRRAGLLEEQLHTANLNINRMVYQDAVAQVQPSTAQPSTVPTPPAQPPTGPPPPPTEPATPAHQPQATVINTHLSSKLPNPDRLDDGKNSEWEFWSIQMLGKLAANADHYPTEVSKLHYV
ncbi:hypothetical protein MMC07_009356 [Pseudocyphellaria aurata]|nr:hypothetical protein [Pseudocyphellaria aurata]